MTSITADAAADPVASSAYWLAAGIIVLLFVAAYVTGNVWINDTAVLALIGVLLQSGLRRPHWLAWLVWLASAGALVAIGGLGNERLAFDLLPVIFNAAFCTLFGSSLLPGETPLITRLIETIEGRERLALPRVAAYARALTWGWALLLGLQAIVLMWLATRDFGATAQTALSSSPWRWYLHFGGFALVPAFIVAEYVFRRWWLRALPHMSLPQFLVQLVRNWPALVRSVGLAGVRSDR